MTPKIVVVVAPPFLPRPAHPLRSFLRHRHPSVRPLKPISFAYTFDVSISRCLFQGTPQLAHTYTSPTRGSAASATSCSPGAVGNPKSLPTLLLEMETTIGLGVSDNRSTSFSEWPISRRIGDIEEACGIHTPASGTNADGEENFALSNLRNRINFAAYILNIS